MAACAHTCFVRLAPEYSTSPPKYTRHRGDYESSNIFRARGPARGGGRAGALEVRHEQIDGLVGLRDEHEAHLDVCAERIAGRASGVCAAAAGRTLPVLGGGPAGLRFMRDGVGETHALTAMRARGGTRRSAAEAVHDAAFGCAACPCRRESRASTTLWTERAGCPRSRCKA
jgi:hypothetical protein